MRFYLGTHHVSQSWFDIGMPLFISRRILRKKKHLPEPTTGWVLDSGGFTELHLYGGWQTSPAEYIADVHRFERDMGHLAWVAPQDWMCEPFILGQTGLTVAEHQARTIHNFLSLRDEIGDLVIPVLQGWSLDDYQRCWELYAAAGIALEDEDTVGLGTICRRQNMVEAAQIVRSLQPLRLHGFGVKTSGLTSFSDALASADSMAWSYAARREPPLYGCTHRNCANCQRYALRWCERIINGLGQLRLEVPCAV